MLSYAGFEKLATKFPKVGEVMVLLTVDRSWLSGIQRWTNDLMHSHGPDDRQQKLTINYPKGGHVL